jgi:hypothetical protein
MQVLKTVFFKPIWHETQQITSQMGGTDHHHQQQQQQQQQSV